MANRSAGPSVPAMIDRKLKRTVGMWMATALVIGNMVGSDIFLLPASLSAACRIR
jgi:APA family basic amino acid/polyamine antiporter